MQTSAINGFRLSPQQEHLWRALGEGHSPGLVVQGVLEIAGAFDPDRLRRALRAAVERHEILRTTFDHLPGMILPVQVILEDAPLEIERRSVDSGEEPEEALERLAAEARTLPFDFAREPLVRAWLVEGFPDSRRLLLTLPALVADAPSLARLAAEVAAACTGTAETGGEPLQYADAAEILHDWTGAPEEEPGIAYWRRQDFSALARPDGAGPGGVFAPRQVRLPLGRERSARFEALAGQMEATVPLLLLAAWHAVLWRSTGEAEVVVGVCFDGRTCDEFIDALGPFSRMLPVRSQLDAATTLPDLVRSLSATVADAARRQDFFSTAKIYGALAPAGGPPRWPWAFDAGTVPPFGLEVPPSQLPFRMLHAGSDRCDVRLSLHGEREELALDLHFDPLQRDEREAGRLLERLLALLEGAAADPARPLAEIDVLTADERRELLAPAGRSAGSPGLCAHELFAEQARRTPEAPALVALDGAALLTYAELAARATWLAHHLRALGVAPGDRVGLCAERSPEDPSLLVGLLAVLAAGGAYVPLDPSYPAERLGYQMEDSGISVLLSTPGPLTKLPVPAGVRVVCLDAGVQGSGEPLPRIDPDGLAYVLYTSGSTGRPKGVMVSHRGLANYLCWAREAYEAGAGRGTPVHSPIGFDLTVTSLLVPLVAASPVCLLPEGPGLGELATALRAGRDFTLVKLTPAHLEALRHVLPGAEAAGAARVLVIGGEALWAESLAFWRQNAPGTRLINEYGPTEATVGCCVHEVAAGDPATGPVPIGRPIANTRLYLVGSGLQPVPGGVEGELWIGGDGLARGYLGRPDLTAERFVPDPFGGEAGGRLYRTGDLVRRRRDGLLEFLGRIDDQVKIRGFRIEPGEIEAVLAGHPAVREAAVVARDEPGGKRLAAYFVARNPITPAELRAFAAGQLPEHMVPSTFTPLSALPLTPNGKLDRKALPEPAADGEAAGYTAPRTLLEELLAEIWAGALETARVGIDDPFFSLGGDSILAIKVVSLAQKRGVSMVLQDLFQHPTIRALAAALRQRSGLVAAVPEGGPLSLLSAGDLLLLPAGIEDAYPLSQVQAGMLFHSERDPEGAVYHVQHSFRLRVRFDAELLQRSVDRVVERHPVLRTSFDLAAFGEPLQLVHQTAAAPVGIDDLRPLGREEQRKAVLAWLAENRHRAFDWRRPPLVRFHVHRCGDEEIQLTLSLHHAILDGWSAAALLAELFRLYMSLLEGVTPPEEPPIAASFRELVQIERSLLASPQAIAAWDGHLDGWELTRVPRLGGGRPGAEGAEVLVSHPEPEVSEGLHRFARTAGVPLKSALLAAHFRVLALLSGRSDVLTGMVGHGRPEREDGERVLGMFLNTLPMRLRLPGGTWAELAQAAFDLERDLLPFRAFPVPELQRRHGGRPLFEAVFNFLHYHVYRSVAGIPGAEVLEVTDYEEINYPLMATFFLSPADGQVQFLLNYHPAEFGRDEIAQAARRYAAVLAALVVDPAGRYDETPLLSTAEQRQVLVDWNGTRTDFGAAGWLPGLIAAQAARTPQAVAVVCEGRSLTYEELEAAANRLARRLRRLGVGPEALAGVAMERSPELVVALLGILKAGAAYVPLDPAYPRERLLYMLEDSGVHALLTQRHLTDLLPAGTARRLCLDDPAEGLEAESAQPLPAEVDGDSAAYMIYTSGSTGRPKGAVNTHAGLRNRLLWMQEAYGLTPGDRVLQKTPFSFDVSVWEFFWPLLTGARLVLARPGGHQDPVYLARLIAAEGITTLHFVPSMLQVFLEEDEAARCTGVRRVVCSGEALTPALVERFFQRLPGVELHNLYGPTEAAVDVTAWACRPGAAGVPIGFPVANTRIYLLDELGQPVPVGTPGELHIGGVQLARGYHGRPGLTAERFVPDPLAILHGEPGARLYRTGDRARHRPDGAIEYLGRIDFQVKVRGVRIEPGEIEAVLAAHPGVREAAVLVREEEGGNRLAAYVVPSGELTVPALRAFLGERLPDALVPSTFTLLEALPLTPSGKLDRRALPVPDAGEEAAAYAAPRTLTEQLLAEIWAGTLDAARVGLDDPFFSLGGDSIRAIRVASLARRRGLPVSLQDLFQHPTVRGLAAELGKRQEAAAEIPGPAPFAFLSAEDQERLPAGLDDAYPLAQLQAGMLFHSQAEPGTSTYHDLHSFHLSGRFDLELLQEAVDRVTARHPALRTSFDLTRFSEPLQLVHARVRLLLEVTDLRELAPAARDEAVAAWLAGERACAFDWERPPLVRFHVHERGEEAFQFTLSFHHCVLDGWSAATLLAELFRTYVTLLAGGELAEEPPAPGSYGEFVALERSALASAAARGFWERQVRGATASRLPRWSTPAEGAAGARELPVPLPVSLSDGAQGLARRLALPVKSVLLAAHLRVMAQSTGKADVVSGLVANGRPEREGSAGMLGLFLNTLPFRLRLGGGATWRGLVQETFALERDMLPFRRYPLAMIQREHGGQAPFEAIFNFLHYHVYRELAELRGVEVVRWDSYEETNFPLTVHFLLDPASGNLRLLLNYRQADLAEAEAAALGRSYLAALEALVADPDARYEEVALLSTAEQELILDAWNHTRAELGPKAGLGELFAAQAAATPDAVALVFEGSRLTYRELDRASNRLAHRLLRLGTAPEALVGVAMERSAELLVALLGVLKAGAAYVPLDPAYPRERLLFLLEDSGVRLVLTQSHLAGLLRASGATVLHVDDPGLEAESTGLPSVAVEDGSAAYVIYTSGSTGRPKGVVNSHGGVRNRLLWGQSLDPLTPEDRVLQKTPFSFDVSVWELFWPLLVGARLVVARPGGHQDPAYIAGLIAGEGVTTAHFVPSMLQVFLEEPAAGSCASLRRVVCSGEALSAQLRDRFFARFPDSGVELYNFYGPTEAAIEVTFWRCGRDDRSARVPIGFPVANTRMHVLDELGHPTPVGVPGELHIGGVQLARGYHQRPDLTAGRFVPDPFAARAPEPGARLYRTGDLARYRADGAIEYLGRTDDQVKVRGFRIELGEIEATLAAHPAVREAAVAVREDLPDARRLAAYVVLHPAQSAAGADLRQFLLERLPEHMVPAFFVALPALPLNPSGKLDRRALPAPAEAGLVREAGYAAPRTSVEEMLAEIWARVLRVERIGIHDNFFDLGGDSILSIQVGARANQAGLRLSPGHLFRHPTIAELAPALASTSGTVAEQGPVTGPAPLSPVQHWFFEQDLLEPQHYNHAIRLEWARRPDPRALAAAYGKLIDHHDTLRLRFAREGTRWRQTHAAPGGPPPFALVDLSALPAGAREQAREAIEPELQASLDLAAGPLTRMLLLDAGDAEPARVLWVTHHAVVDPGSWWLLVADLETAYLQAREGRPLALPPKTTSFRRWAESLRQAAVSPEVLEQLPLWLAQSAPAGPRLPLDFPDGANTEGSRVSIEAPLDARETEILLGELTAAYRATIGELLVTAVLLGLSRWTGAPGLRLTLEGAARDEAIAGVDLERTVGWFTAFYPVAFRLRDLADPVLALRDVKEQLRRIPGQGLGYGLLRYLGPDEVTAALGRTSAPEVTFHYLGQIGVTPEGSEFRPIEGTAATDRGARNPRAQILEIGGFHLNGRLHLLVAYSRNLHRASTIERLAGWILEGLRALIAARETAAERSLAPSDFPLARLDQRQLDLVLARNPEGVNDIYALSPMQEGLVFHSLLAPGSGLFVQHVLCSLHGDLHLEAFRRAWEKVAERQATLRTSFTWDGLDHPVQVVQRSASLPLEVVDWRGLGEAERERRLAAEIEQARRRGFDLERPPQMSLMLIRIEDRVHRLLWFHHHLLLDGWSRTRLIQEVRRFYEAGLEGEQPQMEDGPPFRDYIAWLQEQDPREVEAYWRRELAGFRQPTPLPGDLGAESPPDAEVRVDQVSRFLSPEMSEALQALARRQQVTLSTLMQGAWAVLLSRSSGESDVVFGAVVSGRPPSLPGVDAMIGLLINTLPVRARVEPGASAFAWLRDLQVRQIEARRFEHSPLPRIQTWSEVPGGKGLFDSLVVFENYPLGEPEGSRKTLEIRDFAAGGAGNNPLTLAVLPEVPVHMQIRYSPHRFQPAGIERLLSQLERILERLLQNPDSTLRELAGAAAEEREQLINAFNDELEG